MTDSASTLTLATTGLQVKIQKSPYRVAVYKADGTTLIARQYDPATFRNVGWASDGATTVTKIEDHWYSPSGERFEGFGERYDYLDQRGKDVHNYVYNQYQDQGANHRTYLSVPFFTNSAGYGMYLPSTRYSIFNLGTHLSDMAGFTVDTSGALNSTADYYFFTGSRAEILDDYTATTARPELPPKWAFGLWMSANEWNTQSEVMSELANVTSNNIPHSAMVLEQWSRRGHVLPVARRDLHAEAGQPGTVLFGPDIPVGHGVVRPEGHGHRGAQPEHQGRAVADPGVETELRHQPADRATAARQRPRLRRRAGLRAG